MRFAYWSREIAGWALVLAGLFFFWQSYTLLLNKRVFEAAPLSFIGFIVFRGGIHIMKVAVAAQAARNFPEAAPSAGRRVTVMPARAIGPTPTSSVLPGPSSGRGTATNNPA
ncbi:MAG: hypothetical protein C0467_18460 [Planctomycetaceae bacterium]|nr:hypothetical protein [Planctomycetaceae bacterium]